MVLSDQVVACYPAGFSGVYIDCPKGKIDEIVCEFNSLFEEIWPQVMDAAEEEYGSECFEKVNEIAKPANARNIGDRAFVEVGPLCLGMGYGARADNVYGPDALEGLLKQLKESYPQIAYEGVIAYEWCDEHAADVINYEIGSEQLSKNNKKTYPFIGDIFKKIFMSEVLAADFWEKMEEQLFDAEEDDYKQILRDFHIYGAPEEAINQLVEMAEEYDEDLAEEMQEIIEVWKDGD